MSHIAIDVKGLGKKYYIGSQQEEFNRLGDRLLHSVTAPFRRARGLLRGQATGAAELHSELWALEDVSFQINQGDVVGIVGRNGAGKSTLLKILSRITDPTDGEATIYGRVGSLLEVGTGFHPELTGRENIYLNGAILGMKRNEISRKFDEIVAFAELAKFIDTPVKHYSSGMYVRLAFSVAAHLEPEILLVDEVLAVGDVSFQRKCLGKMDDVARLGRTVVFVSHNMALLQKLCRRGLFLHEGRLQMDDNIEKTIESYLSTLEEVERLDVAQRTDRQGEGRIRLEKLDIIDAQGESSRSLPVGRPVRFVFQLNGIMPRLSCVFTVFNQLGQRVVHFKSDQPAPADKYSSDGEPVFICDLDDLLLVPGRYYINVLIRGGGEWQDFLEAAATFDVLAGQLNGRIVQPFREISVTMPHCWTQPEPV